MLTNIYEFGLYYTIYDLMAYLLCVYDYCLFVNENRNIFFPTDFKSILLQLLCALCVYKTAQYDPIIIMSLICVHIISVSRLHCESESFKMELILDINSWIYPMDLGELCISIYYFGIS